MARLRFHLDEHVSNSVARALRTHGIDVTTTVEARLRTAQDADQLQFARAEGRVLVTFDADFLRLHAEGVPHAGIAYCALGSRSIGHLVSTIQLMYEVMTAEEMHDAVEYL